MTEDLGISSDLIMYVKKIIEDAKLKIGKEKAMPADPPDRILWFL